jgi:hypothetical protein
LGYDQLFKTILEKLLRDFLELFFPEAAARLDFQTLRFVDKEVFANVPEGTVREADVIAKLQTREGKPELVLVHIEVQTEPESDFPRRMFEYYSVCACTMGFPSFPSSSISAMDRAPESPSTGRASSSRSSCSFATTRWRWHGFRRRSMLRRARSERLLRL